jgi:hypothetical protein
VGRCAANVYWTNACSGATGCGVFTLPKAGGTPLLIAASDAPEGIAVDDTSVYWAETGTGAVMQAPKQGGPPQQLAAPDAWDVALDDAFVYWTDQGSSVGRVPKGGGPQETLVKLSAGVSTVMLAVDDTRVYFSVQLGSAGFVASAPKAGGAPTMLAKDLELPYGVALDAESVYVAVKSSGASGSIVKVPKGGGPVTTVVSDLPDPSNLALDDACVYWSNGNSVRRAPK